MPSPLLSRQARRALLVLASALASACTVPCVSAQALPLTTIAPLAATVGESSGLIRSHASGHWWTHNDSGGEAKLYRIDSTGTVVRTVRLLGVTNVDWEEVTADDAGHIYVGDFGNNANDRQDLVIYQLPHPDLLAVDSVAPTAIHFSYADQVAFPPAANLLHYDMEAMVAWGDSLYLFSKNRTDPFDGYTRLHVLPAQAGTYVAQVRDSFYTGPGPMLNYWVCAAALSPDQQHLLLVSYTRGWLFSCFPGRDFFAGAVVELTWSLAQREAAAWSGNDTLYMTDERINGQFGGNLYRALMGRYTAEPDAALGADTVYYGAALHLQAPPLLGATYLWSTGATSDSLVVTTSGTYHLTVTAPNGCTDSDTIDVQVLVGNAAPASAVLRAGLYLDASGMSRLRLEADLAGDYDWEVHDLGGMRLAAGRQTLQARQVAEVHLPQLASGLYFVSCAGPAGQVRVKCMVGE